MKTITQILNEMILENKKEIENLKNEIKLTDKIQTNQATKIDFEIAARKDIEEIIKQTIKKVKKITLLLSIATILNAISIILLNLWR